MEGATYQDDLKKHFLIYLHKLLIPFLDIGCLLAGVGVVLGGLLGFVTVMLAPLNNFAQNSLVDLEYESQ